MQFWGSVTSDKLWRRTIPVEIVETSPSHGIVRIAACLLADADAAEIGYAAICRADFAVPYSFNPEIKLIRDLWLMKLLFRVSFKADE